MLLVFGITLSSGVVGLWLGGASSTGWWVALRFAPRVLEGMCGEPLHLLEQLSALETRSCWSLTVPEQEGGSFTSLPCSI